MDHLFVRYVHSFYEYAADQRLLIAPYLWRDRGGYDTFQYRTGGPVPEHARSREKSGSGSLAV